MQQRSSILFAFTLGATAVCGCSSTEQGPGGAAGSGATPAPTESAPPEGSASNVPEPMPTSSATTDVEGMMPSTLAGAGGEAPDPVASAMGGGGGAAPVPTTPTTPPFDGSFILGADISGVQETISFGTTFVDTDGVQKDIFDLLANHGFNYIRLRTFVNPTAQYGYASGDGGCQAKQQAFNDAEHTVAFAREVKAKGFGFLLDLHYSDTWADPGKQVIPEAWRGETTIDGFAARVRQYTVDVVSQLVAAGARPDMVQVGNEITPGMLIHLPTANTDCYGNNSTPKPGANGSQNNWDNLAALLRAGIEGVREVDASIKIMLHVENTESQAGVASWVRNAQQRGVTFDVLGLSAYEAFQGPSSAWRNTLNGLATTFPELSFAIAEYNPQRRLLNDIMRELPDGRGLGTFFWEPTQSGSWGQAMFTWDGNTLRANAQDFAAYDQMRLDYGL